MPTIEKCPRTPSSRGRRGKHLGSPAGRAGSTADTRISHDRWYDPSVGRWLSEDPSGLAGGDDNLYRYCGNGPTDGTDPSGLADQPPPGLR
jgi:RHS repeat-associated protein